MITNVRLRNFRRHVETDLKFESGVNFIEGENNAGKTSLFMAIEYALFGNVHGFRSQSALLNRVGSTIGVEVIFQGKDGMKYKLQRLHEITTRGNAKGHYTLKQVREDGEKYLLSSDFQDNPEEKLQLKLIELLGVSKRLFEVAVNVRQGEISGILDGAPTLDIVLGVSAASTAEKELRSIALGFEKEIKELPTIKASLEGFIVQQQNMEKQKETIDIDGLDIDKRINEFTDELERIGETRDAIKPVQVVMNELIKKHYEAGSMNNLISMHQGNLDDLGNEFGDIDTLVHEIDTLEGEMMSKSKTIDVIEVSQQTHVASLREYEQQLGNLIGMINRRSSITTANCEVCGANIDQTRVEQELKQWSQDRIRVESEITRTEEEISKLKSLAKEESHIKEELTRNKIFKQSKLEHMRELQSTIATNITNLKPVLGEMKELLASLIEEENKLKTIIPSIEIHQHTLEIDDWTTWRIIEYGGHYFKQITELETAENQIKVSLSYENENKRKLTIQKQELDINLMQLNERVADLTDKIILLNNRQAAADKLRRLSAVFKIIQKTLREQSSTELAKHTLENHEELTGSKEFIDIKVDPAKYSVYVKPVDLNGQEVLASLYQGGGHKLLLGLAYKLAIIKLVTNPLFILLDEPTYGLDSTNKSNLFANITKVIPNSQLLIITHQLGGQIKDHRIEVVKQEKLSEVIIHA